MANQFRRVNLIPKIILLFLIILILGVLGVLWFDLGLGILDARQQFAPVLKLVGLEQSPEVASYEDPLLLDKERFIKEKAALAEKSDQLDKMAMEIDEKEKILQQRMDELQEREKDFLEQEKSFNQRLQMYDNKRANLEQNARYLEGMPPENAVGILQGMEDQDMIDVLRTSQRLADLEGRDSIVSYWLSLMPAERAAAIQRKMAERPAD